MNQNVCPSTPACIPAHVAIIMDGNGRWAQQRGLERSAGHRAGSEAARAITTEACKLGIQHLTLYTFSRENWNRPKVEVRFLFELLVSFLKNELDTLEKQGISLQILGELGGLPTPTRLALQHAISRTAPRPDRPVRMTLNLALNYSGREELVRACRHIVEDGISPDDITETALASRLYTTGQPDPDFVIRTSGEVRISNFLLYQCAYSEFFFTDTLWPDFTPALFREALTKYAARNRRFGQTQEQTS